MTLEDRIGQLQKQFDNFRIIGGEGVTVHGEMQRGYALHFDPDTDAQGSVPITERGACCFDDGSCFDNVVEGDCLGTYQGDGTTCATFTCPILGCTDAAADNFDPTATEDDGSCEYTFGACCFNDDCFIDTEFNCNTYGVYQGDDTECEPNPCPDPVGACCEDGGFCSEGPEDSCFGVYQGDDTICVSVDCPTGCPTIAMTCDSISSAKGKCGFLHDSSYFRQRTHTFDYVFSVSCPPDYGDCSGSFFETVGFGDRVDCLGGYSLLSYGGSGSGSGHASPDVDFGDNTAVTTISPGLCGFGGHAFEFTDLHTTITYTGTAGIRTLCPAACGASCGCCFASATVTTSDIYGDEYTTSELVSNAEDALPSYGGSYTGGACASSRYLSTDEHTYSIQRSKPKFSFSSVAFDFYVCYNEHFTPAGGGGGYDVPVCVFVSAGSTEVYGPELFEPPANGTTAIRDIICLPA